MARVTCAKAQAAAIAVAFFCAQPALVVAQSPAPAAQKPAAAKAKKKSQPAAKEPDAAKSVDPAAIQRQIDAAQKALDAGKLDLAISEINGVMGQKGLEARAIARALAIRGQAYRRQGKPAQAIADLQSALHLKGGLSDSERAAALQARSEAYREAGLPEPQSVPGGPRTASPTSPGPSTPVRTGSNRQPEPSAPAPQSPGIGNFFSSLFGGNAPKPTPPAASPPQVPAAVPIAETPPKQTAVPVSPPVRASQAAPAKALPSGSIRLQLAGMRSQKEARALAERVSKDFGTALGGHRFEIAQAVYGNMGTFYHARFGPYSEATEPTAVCAALKAKGIDCQVLSQ